MVEQNDNSISAMSQFKRMMAWIVLVAVLTVGGALWFAAATTGLTVHMVVAMTAGILVSVVLGSGLFALAFFSDKSGHDQRVTDASRVSEAPQDGRTHQADATSD